MKRVGIAAAALVAMLGVSTAYAGDDGAAAGAVTGGVAGAVVGGPVGAAVGAGAGAIVGGAASGPDRKQVIIEHRDPATTGSVCSSETVRRENGLGDAKTVTRESCN